MYGPQSAFLSKLNNMNAKIKIYKDLFYNKNPTFEK